MACVFAKTEATAKPNSGQICPRLRPHRGRASFAKGQKLSGGGTASMPVREKARRSPGSCLRVPSHVPSHPQTAAKVRGFSLTASEFTAETDWLLEGSGFE